MVEPSLSCSPTQSIIYTKESRSVWSPCLQIRKVRHTFNMEKLKRNAHVVTVVKSFGENNTLLKQTK